MLPRLLVKSHKMSSGGDAGSASLVVLCRRVEKPNANALESRVESRKRYLTTPPDTLQKYETSQAGLLATSCHLPLNASSSRLLRILVPIYGQVWLASAHAWGRKATGTREQPLRLPRREFGLPPFAIQRTAR
jgi:hypothetical protein